MTDASHASDLATLTFSAQVGTGHLLALCALNLALWATAVVALGTDLPSTGLQLSGDRRGAGALAPDGPSPHHGAGLRRYYRYVDALVGRLLEGRGPDDLVIVLSDHGFELNRSGERQGGIHESPKARDGVLYMRGRGVPTGRSDLVMRMAEITPTVLAWMGMSPARDMDGGPSAFVEIEALPPIDTYDRTPIEFVGKRSHEVESRMIEDLKTLGYVK